MQRKAGRNTQHDHKRGMPFCRMDGNKGQKNGCGSSSVGRASAFQAECRGFESRSPLSQNEVGGAVFEVVVEGAARSAGAGEEQQQQAVPR